MTEPTLLVERAHDRISIDGIIVSTIVGALPHEREIRQPIRVDLSLLVDLHDAGRSDELADTVHYGEVAIQVADALRESKDVLLERLADRVAEIAVSFERVEAVEVTVTKIRPPVPEHLEHTSVTIARSASDYELTPRIEHSAIVALGSNLGDRAGYLRLAVERLGTVTKMSQLYETDPVGGPSGQDAFLNMVVEVRTSLDPYAFLRRCRQIEADGMRQRTVRWGPRTLDVDVLFYEDITIDDPVLTLPHPRYAERRFVLAPLSDIAPERCPQGWEDTVPDDGVRAIGPLPEA
jgi:dihydroneopterin aldolase/2-amino-4-hydroxy-6-hydroxymethyldihydropteridine diphosphokinase